jgi:hypothetical protein
MRASSPRQRGNRGWRKIPVNEADMPKVAALLREAGPIAGDGDPTAAHAHYDPQGRVRRVHATYANGWRATLVLRVDGSFSLSQAIKLVSQPKGATA